jgi:hypothetical protein
MTTRWTAPATGTYAVLAGQEPRLLTDEEAVGHPEAAYLLRLQAGDVLMNSGATLATSEPSLTIPVDWP